MVFSIQKLISDIVGNNHLNEYIERVITEINEC